MSNEADTCRKYITPKLITAGWEQEPHSLAEQRKVTDGRIVRRGTQWERAKPKRADYLLRYTRDYTIAVVEAKSEDKTAAEGMQQAKDYAALLGLKFAYATNGHNILEFDFNTGREIERADFPSPDELWKRLTLSEQITDNITKTLLSPFSMELGKIPRYYQEIAINRSVQAILQGKRRILLTMATGCGKTVVAFQTCWKLWSARWNRTGENRRPKILFLSDRNVLVDQPMEREFAPFKDARCKIENGQVSLGREMYFAIYQAIAQDERRPGLYREFPSNFFDLIVIDECHRGSARDESNWREILDYFEPAFQLGMTATPLREDNRDTYEYFGNPIYQYSLRQGIDDGFLAPYTVHRIVSMVDATGWRPLNGETDRFGREIPDREYGTQDFERTLSIRARTEAIARNLTDFLHRSDRYAKTIVFCVDQEHASEMRCALNNLNADLVQQHFDYVCRVTSDEGEIGRGHLDHFQELETSSPVILTTSQLLTTGVDAPMCKNIVIVRTINSMTEFKQIIGRGTRVREDYGKLSFNILDYTGSASKLFADPEFDGDPARIVEGEMDENGKTTTETDVDPGGDEEGGEIDVDPPFDPPEPPDEPPPLPRKFYVDGGKVEIAAHLVYELDAEGNRLRVVQLTDYTGEYVRTLFPDLTDLRYAWSDTSKRDELLQKIKDHGIDLPELARVCNLPDADEFDLLSHLAYSQPLRTRRERAELLKREQSKFFEQYSGEARFILEELLEKYAMHGVTQLKLPDILRVSPLTNHGSVAEIVEKFGYVDLLRNAVNELQALLYAA